MSECLLGYSHLSLTKFGEFVNFFRKLINGKKGYFFSLKKPFTSGLGTDELNYIPSNRGNIHENWKHYTPSQESMGKMMRRYITQVELDSRVKIVREMNRISTSKFLTRMMNKD
jgi:hypothetical protein